MEFIEMSKDSKNIVFMARTPDGHEYKVFRDGTCEGFSDEIRVYNYWLPMYQYTETLQKKTSEPSSMVAIDLPASGEWQLISSTSFDPPEALGSRSQSELEEPQSDT